MARVERDCGWCGQPFTTFSWIVARGRGRYCNAECARKARGQQCYADVTARVCARHLRDFHDEHGYWPSQIDWTYHRPEGSPSASTIYDRCGSWPAAREMAQALPASRRRETMRALVRQGGMFVHAAFTTSLGTFCGEDVAEFRVKPGEHPTCPECRRTAYAWNVDGSAPASWFDRVAA